MGIMDIKVTTATMATMAIMGMDMVDTATAIGRCLVREEGEEDDHDV